MDRDLVLLAQRGDHDAFTVLATGVGDGLFHVARLILRDVDLAEDAVQDTLIRAWRRLPNLRDPDHFEAWIRRMLINACYDERRRGHRQAIVRLLPDAAAPVRADALDVRDRLESGMQRLPIEQRTVLVLHHYVGLSLIEISEAVGAPVGTIKSRLHYATRAMRAALDADDRAEPGAGRDRSA